MRFVSQVSAICRLQPFSSVLPIGLLKAYQVFKGLNIPRDNFYILSSNQLLISAQTVPSILHLTVTCKDKVCHIHLAHIPYKATYTLRDELHAVS